MAVGGSNPILQAPFILSWQTVKSAAQVIWNGNGGQVVPDTTPPGAIQLEEVPVNAKPVRFPLLPFPVASVNMVSVELSAPANPWLK